MARNEMITEQTVEAVFVERDRYVTVPGKAAKGYREGCMILLDLESGEVFSLSVQRYRNLAFEVFSVTGEASFRRGVEKLAKLDCFVVTEGRYLDPGCTWEFRMIREADRDEISDAVVKGLLKQTEKDFSGLRSCISGRNPRGAVEGRCYR